MAVRSAPLPTSPIPKAHDNVHNFLAVDVFNTPIFASSQGQRIPHCYSPFGFSSDSSPLSGFKGEYKDPISNGYLLGNGRRLYSTSLMRFSSPDPLSPFSEGGVNAFAFVLNDPVNLSDPSGLIPQFLARALPFILPNKTYRGEIKWQHDGIIAFTGKPRNDGRLETLYIHSHGSVGVLGGDQLEYTASDIFIQLSINGVEMRNRQTHIIACNSATRNAGGRSFADDMAKLTKAQSSGYDGYVSTVDRVDAKGSYNVHRLSDMWIYRLISITSTKTRRGDIRNPHKIRGSRSKN